MTALIVRYGRPEALPLDVLLSSIPSLPRRAIDRLDELDGDVDVEANGDELDGSLGEDDFHAQPWTVWTGPGCPVSDPGEHDDHDEPDGRELLP